VECFEQGEFARALELFKKISSHGHDRQEAVARYLDRIDASKATLHQEAVDLLRNNWFEPARLKFAELLELDPDLAPALEPCLAVIERKTEIREQLLQLASQAREEGRFVEAKVIYAYLCSQWPDLHGRLAPCVDEIGDRAEIHLGDSVRQGRVDCSCVGASLDGNGFFIPQSGARQARQNGDSAGRVPAASPQPLPDTLPPPVDIDGEGVADFTY
jgi:tetratricopeptide (TPR) repeat protein